MGMRAVAIDRSSVIDRIAYDEASTTLRISFRDTGDYLYFDVPAELFDRFHGADSAGSFFNEHIKDRYRYRRDRARRRFGLNA